MLQKRKYESVISISLILALGWALPATAAAASLKGSVVTRGADGTAVYLPGASVTVRSETGTFERSVITDDSGRFSFTDLPAGDYTLVVELQGFEKSIKSIVIAGGVALEENIELAVAAPAENVTVRAESGETVIIDANDSSTRDRLTENTLDTTVTPLRNDKFTDALPLLPGVVRGPDGLLNIKGARASQSSLLVNSANVVDPVTGEFGISLPIDAVQSVEVLSNPYSAEHGRFSSAVTSVETRPGGNKLQVQVNNLIPRLRRRAGTIAGIEAFTPRLRLSGPIIKDKLFFAQSFQYRFVRTRVPNLPDLENDTVLESFDSFSQFDYEINANHHLTASFSVFPQKNAFVNLNTFNPIPVTPNYRQRGFNFALYERAIFDNGSFLESLFNLKQFDADVFPQGGEAMVLAPDVNSGNFFNRQSRDTLKFQVVEAYTFQPLEAGGKHLVKVGIDASYTTFTGSDSNNTINVVRADGTLGQRIAFVGRGRLEREDTELAVFLQDKWEINSALALDLGLRVDRNTITDENNFAPRAGFVLSPFQDRKTIFKGGAGIFYDKVPLNVGVFKSFQQRVVTTFARDGVTVLDGPRLFRHEIDGRLKTPYGVTWNFEVDRELSRKLVLRFNYLERRGKREFVLNPLALEDGTGALLLASAGRSKYRELQMTARYQPAEEGELFFSYVRSWARGDLNDFNQFFGNFRNPIVRPNEFSVLPFDVPHRFLFWGSIHLPYGVVLAPVLEIRNGFPFSIIDEDRNFIGSRNRAGRFPAFASLDLQVSKEIKVSKYKARVGVKIFNVTNSFNPRDVQNNIDSAAFGGFFNSVGRFFRGTFQIEY